MKSDKDLKHLIEISRLKTSDSFTDNLMQQLEGEVVARPLAIHLPAWQKLLLALGGLVILLAPLLLKQLKLEIYGQQLAFNSLPLRIGITLVVAVVGYYFWQLRVGLKGLEV